MAGIRVEATGFDVRASEYEKGRPSYPEAAVLHLAEVLGVAPGSTVMDLAAGTGKLTRQLVGLGADVVAVEPVAGMRSVLSRTVPEARVLAGTAESIPVRSAVADSVTVAQAFHWFDGYEALPEIRRVLRPRGRLALVWNVRDLSQRLQSSLEAVMARYRGSSPSQAGGAWREPFGHTDLFGSLHSSTFPMEHRLSRDELVARALSTSFIARLPGTEQQRVAQEVAALCPGAGHASMAYLTEVYWCAPK